MKMFDKLEILKKALKVRKNRGSINQLVDQSGVDQSGVDQWGVDQSGVDQWGVDQ
jgi:hypothetical protein